MEQEILMVKIHNAIKEGKTLYESTNGNWKINRKRLKHIRFVLGINNGEVVCGYQPTKWYQIEEGTESGRSFFEGSPIDEGMLNKMQSSNEILKNKFGTGSAIAYAYVSELH
ncbi:hypothetical protein [Halobacillus trueperi]|uniref:Uncharacterized protein n=1 Tax=Halobacillus trueperi TaxID=156205 RepID=A0A3E0J4K5_9BACI|nr:hypothetical protein [Halobacillus trueperi]REJ07739.1 hypothetical protein DYE48_15340 [Halobacillus trueperi]